MNYDELWTYELLECTRLFLFTLKKNLKSWSKTMPITSSDENLYDLQFSARMMDLKPFSCCPPRLRHLVQLVKEPTHTHDVSTSSSQAAWSGHRQHWSQRRRYSGPIYGNHHSVGGQATSVRRAPASKVVTSRHNRHELLPFEYAFVGSIQRSKVGCLWLRRTASAVRHRCPDKLEPLKRIAKRCDKPCNKWLSAWALPARRSRRQLDRSYRRNRTDSSRRAYRAACRGINQLIQDSRWKHLDAKLAETTSDDRGHWKVIKELLHSDECTAKRDAAENQKMSDAFLQLLLK